ncbi:hypothetical protein HQQ82_03415 [Rathayibacter sp. VKM Ac-2856]|uniref:hypothetical protein n=1 Tax=unclassified Rathayibacter TaxID=2609250 RepID=UPI00156361DE|nr:MULTISPECIES: hypothetical protein [unclassified Rathayibacter]NQX03843.1 hypothetical protein [Rathayibacter sp. VKM Ac-2858]NQX19011.1 hypothetical protein [Rathayibacter sp. VKM Ac-2856]
MNEELYILDNNALSHLSRAQRESKFFLERCFLPTEIIYEAQGYPDKAAFKEIEYPTTSTVLEHLAKVMASIQIEDSTLVNLYTNKGAADPILIACALDAQECTADQLWGPTWVIVTNDKAVTLKAAALDVASCTREEFLSKNSVEW